MACTTCGYDGAEYHNDPIDCVDYLRSERGDAELDRDRVRGLSVREITILTERLQSGAGRCKDLRAKLETAMDALRRIGDAGYPGASWVAHQALAALDAGNAPARLAETEQAQWDRVHWGGEEP